VLVRDAVEVGHAGAVPEVARVGAGVDRLDRGHEPQSVDGGDRAGTERLGERQAAVVIDQQRVGSADRLGAQVALVDPREPVARERRVVAARERFCADVAGFGDQRGADVNTILWQSAPTRSALSVHESGNSTASVRAVVCNYAVERLEHSLVSTGPCQLRRR
jgi:hypothetical protein